ncbi:MAG: hypothetical protein RL033_5840 [Pseudomonadota bacterium]
MKPTPAGWPRITPSVYYLDPHAGIDWLCRAFGFEVRLKVEGEGGRLEHAELVYGDGLIMIGAVIQSAVGQAATGQDDRAKEFRQHYASPRELAGKHTQGLAVFVDDVDAHHARARAAGAEIFREPSTTDYGTEYWADRTYGARDAEGHVWWFMQRVRNPGETLL